MLILLHVLIAICSVVFTTFVYLFPSKTKLHVSYVFVVLTIITGTYLIVTMPSHMVSSCITGLVYLAVVVGEIAAIRGKLAKRFLEK